MPGEQKLSSGVLARGIVDGPDDIYCPEGACLSADGFEFRRGYARTEYGRSSITAAELVTGARILDYLEWERADGTRKYYTFVGGYIYESAAAAMSSTTNRSAISVGASTATRATLAVTISGAKCLLSAQAGDYFYFNTDGASAGGLVASVDSATQWTLSAYTGSATSGAFTLLRKLSTTAPGYLLALDDRLWVFDGVNVPHWYGDRGDGTFEFRPAGLPEPTAIPTVTLASSGALAAGDYLWAYAFEDRGGRVSNPIYTHAVTATATQKSTLGNILNGPSWATKVRIWRTKANGSLFYSTYLDYGSSAPLLVAGTPSDAVPSIITLATGSANLIADQHIHRYVTFATSGNTYRITDNATGTITVATNASTEASGDRITITGGYDIDQVVASGFVDLMDDDSLDIDYQEPDENTQPVPGLTHPIVIDGGGRWMAYEEGTQTTEWFSGRNTYAHIETGAATGGLGEFDYAPQSHEAGQRDGQEIIQNLELGGRAFALKRTGPWEVYKEPIDVSGWDINPVESAQGAGIIAARSVAKKSGAAYWVGYDSGELDIIRFDGNVGYGIMRRHDPGLGTSRMRAEFVEMATGPSTITGAIFRNRYYASYQSVTDASPTPDTYDKILRYDLNTHTVDRQPWAAGVMRYIDTGARLVGAHPGNVYGEHVSKLFYILGSQSDDSSGIARVLIPRAFTFGVDILTQWLYINVRGINGETVTAPTVSYSVDGLPFNAAGKAWETTTSGTAWRTAAGEYVQQRIIESGERSNIIHVKITHTDSKDWGIREIEVVGIPMRQQHQLGT